jgi:hypothetical protein
MQSNKQNTEKEIIFLGQKSNFVVNEQNLNDGPLHGSAHSSALQ